MVGTAADADRGEAVPEATAGSRHSSKAAGAAADRRFAAGLASNPSDWPARFYHSYYDAVPDRRPTPIGGVIQLEHK